LDFAGAKWRFDWFRTNRAESLSLESELPPDSPLLSPCTENLDLSTFVFNGFPGFACNAAALNSWTVVLKVCTKFWWEIVEGLSAKLAAIGDVIAFRRISAQLGSSWI
jgi:hypothetical protein